MVKKTWIGVDWDRTLVEYSTDPNGYNPFKHGDPLFPMVARIKDWLSVGKNVKIFSARASGFPDTEEGRALKLKVIESMQDHMVNAMGLPRLQVTCEKDYLCEAIYDDIAISMIPNTGQVALPAHDR